MPLNKQRTKQHSPLVFIPKFYQCRVSLTTFQGLFLKVRHNVWSGLSPPPPQLSTFNLAPNVKSPWTSTDVPHYGPLPPRPSVPPLDILTSPLTAENSSGHTSLIRSPPPAPAPSRTHDTIKQMSSAICVPLLEVEWHTDMSELWERQNLHMMSEVLLCYGSSDPD